MATSVDSKTAVKCSLANFPILADGNSDLEIKNQRSSSRKEIHLL